VTRKWVAGLAVGVVVLGLAAVRVKRAREKAGAPVLASTPPAVEVAPVRRGTLRETRHFLGEVLGAEEALVSSRILAPIVTVSVREGDPVRHGQELVRLESGELENAIQAATAAVSAAEVASATERDVSARDRVLFEAKAIAQEAWDRSRASEASAESRLLAAREALDSARRRHQYAVITAPFDGVVARREVDPGDLAVPGKTLLTLVRKGGVRVRVKLPAEMLAGLTVGQPLRLQAPDGPLEGRVARVFPAMDAAHLAVVEADVPAPPPGLVSGATVGVDVETGSAEGWIVSARALLEGETGAFVFRARDGQAEPVKVQVASRSSDAAVVAGDLAQGDELIVAQPSRLMTLAEGAPVAVVRGRLP
jgi:membrane fusion protein, multidrug efflux system